MVSTTRSPRRHVRARRRRIYRIRRAVVACACLLLVLGVTLSARGALRTLNALHEQAAAHWFGYMVVGDEPISRA